MFNSGDYVRTSKGKLGVIVRPQGFLLKKENGSQLLFTEEEANRIGGIFEKVKVPNLVKIGNKEFPIWSDKLLKLKELNIKTQQGFSQHVTKLPINDAMSIIDIYQRNGIWFAVE